MPNPETVTQRRTSATAAGIQKPAGAANSVFDVPKAEPKARKPREVAKPIDVSAIKIRRDVPLPPTRTGVAAINGVAYKKVLTQMKAGDSVELPSPQARGLQSFAKTQGVRLALRKVGGDRIGVWRLK